MTLAFELPASPATHPDPGVRTELIALLARCGHCRHGRGQWLDLEADKLGVPDAPNVAHVERLQGMKTGALIHYPCEAGAILGRAEASRRLRLAVR